MPKLTRRQLVAGSFAALASATCGAPPVRPVASGGAPPPTRIVVMGAGIAGLATAFDLMRRGHDVTVLEARAEAGGRVRTLRDPFTDGLFAEAGAKHVVGDPDLIRLIEDVGVELAKRPTRPKLARVRVRAGVRSVDGDDDDESGFSTEERELGFKGRLQKYFAPAVGPDPAGPAWPPREIARYDALSAAEFLRRQGASPRFVRFAEEALCAGGDAGATSALGLMRDVASMLRETELSGGGRIAGGTDRLPKAIATRLGARVVYGAHVRQVERGERSVGVVYERKGEVHRIEAARVVCAVPPRLAALIRFTPALPETKQRALAGVMLASVTRIYLQVRRRFWLDRGEWGDVVTDLRTGDVRDETVLQPGTAGILSAYLSGAAAREIAALDAPARLAAFAADVERAHPGMKEHADGGVSVTWDSEPFARGAYAWFRPGDVTTLAPALAAAVGRIHFAGDHTSYRPGFMHGAVASAKRVVREVTGG